MTTAALEYLKYKETERSNLERERTNRATLTENITHNRALENLQQQSIDEQIRANQARETETNRHNLVSEGISINSLNESIRHNQVSEDNTRYNTNLHAMGTTVQQAVAGKDHGLKPHITMIGSWGDMARQLLTGHSVANLVSKL